jgi:hypothetical protein
VISGLTESRVNCTAGGSQWIDTPLANWAVHPDSPAIDVAVLKSGIPPGWDHLSISSKMAVTEDLIKIEEIGIGDEIFITGLFTRHPGQQTNIPIVRIGNIAAMPAEKIMTEVSAMQAYLVECRSTGGLSGSPVFVNLGLVRHGKFSSSNKPIFRLLGLVCAHYDTNEIVNEDKTVNPNRVNMGIAVVAPIAAVLDTIDRSGIGKATEAFMRQIDHPTLG